MTGTGSRSTTPMAGTSGTGPPQPAGRPGRRRASACPRSCRRSHSRLPQVSCSPTATTCGSRSIRTVATSRSWSGARATTGSVAPPRPDTSTSAHCVRPDEPAQQARACWPSAVVRGAPGDTGRFARIRLSAGARPAARGYQFATVGHGRHASRSRYVVSFVLWLSRGVEVGSGEIVVFRGLRKQAVRRSDMAGRRLTIIFAGLVLSWLGLVPLASPVGASPAGTGDCSAGAHTLAPRGTHLYPDTGNGGYASLHTLVHLVYDANANRFLPGNRVVLTDRATQCLTSFSLDFERKSGNTSAGPDMSVQSVEVNGRPARFTFVQPTYPGDPHGQNDPNPAAHEASQTNPVGGP